MPNDADDDGELFSDAPWAPWTPEEVASQLLRSDARWCVAAGWAIDLFRGRQTRAHHDIEIAVPRDDFFKIRTALEDYEFDVVGSGRRWPLESDAFDRHFQTWLRDPKSGVYHLDVFRDPHVGPEWICRRDERIRMPYADLICVTDSGIPYMSPEVVLLFKAKHHRAKDQSDFDGVLPLLHRQQIQWLRLSLEMIHPGHDWMNALET